MADGHGTTITFGTSAFAANLIAVNSFNATRASVDNTHMGTTVAMASLPAELYDWEMEILIEHDGSDAVPISGANETITIDWAGAAQTYAGSGHVTGYNAGASIGERMEATMSIKGSGEVTGLTS